MLGLAANCLGPCVVDLCGGQAVWPALLPAPDRLGGIERYSTRVSSHHLEEAGIVVEDGIRCLVTQRNRAVYRGPKGTVGGADVSRHLLGKSQCQVHRNERIEYPRIGLEALARI